MNIGYMEALEHEFGQGSGSIRVRHLRVGEVLPPELPTGYENLVLDHDWVWIAEDGYGIQAVLLAGPFHSLAMFGRLVACPGASRIAVPMLLRWVLHELEERGYRGFFAWLDPDSPVEAHLLRTAVKAGGVVEPGRHILVACPVNVEEMLVCRKH